MKDDTPPPLLVSNEDGVVRLRLNRPQQLNTIDVAMAEAFAAACRDLAADLTVRVVVLSGEGRAFGAGGDLSAFRTEPEAAGDRDHRADARSAEAAGRARRAGDREPPRRRRRRQPQPRDGVRPRDRGRRNALQPRVRQHRRELRRVGLVQPGAAGRVCATRWASRCLGETFDAAEALRLGLVNRVVPADRLAAETEAIVARFSKGPTRAVGRMKRLLRSSLDHDLATQLDLESQAFREGTRTRDFAEAMDAFFAKRPPVFEGR